MIAILSKHFNPRPREEGDAKEATDHGMTYGISIHALVKRATYDNGGLCTACLISIHALVKRATI